MAETPMEKDQMTSDRTHHPFAGPDDFKDDSSRPWMEQMAEAASDDFAFEPRTLEDDPAFSRLLEKTDEQVRIARDSAESASSDARKARKTAWVGVLMGLAGVIVAVISLVLSIVS